MPSADLKKQIDLFKNQRVLVVGDVMLDHYTYGKVDRISPEAPVPIIHIVKETYVPGGAGNVFLNLCQFGAQAHLVSVVGDDVSGKKLHGSFNNFPQCGELFFITDATRRTTVKQRLVAGQQQLLRVDTEDTFSLDAGISQKIFAYIKKHISEFHCICVSDYGKGVMTKELAQQIITLARDHNIPTLVDTKPKNFTFYAGCTLVTPNTAEVEAGYPGRSYDDAAQLLAKDLDTAVMVTRGSDGVACFTPTEGEVFSLPSYAKPDEVLDVSGAGDTVVAALALCLSVNMEPEQAAIFASKAAAVAVSKPHTSPVALDEVLAIL